MMHQLKYYCCAIYLCLISCQNQNTHSEVMLNAIAQTNVRNNSASDWQTTIVNHEFPLPDGIEIQLSTLKFIGGDPKVRDNMNRFLEDFALRNLQLFAQSESEFTTFKEAIKANIKAYQNYMHEYGDGWLDVWSIHQFFSLEYQSEDLINVVFYNDYNWEIVQNLPKKISLFFDAKTGKHIPTIELFKDKDQAIAFFQEALKTALIVQEISPTTYQKFLTNTELPFYIIYKKDNLHGMYAACDGIPSAVGEIYIDISLSDIQHLLNYL